MEIDEARKNILSTQEQVKVLLNNLEKTTGLVISDCYIVGKDYSFVNPSIHLFKINMKVQ